MRKFDPAAYLQCKTKRQREEYISLSSSSSIGFDNSEQSMLLLLIKHLCQVNSEQDGYLDELIGTIQEALPDRMFHSYMNRDDLKTYMETFLAKQYCRREHLITMLKGYGYGSVFHSCDSDMVTAIRSCITLWRQCLASGGDVSTVPKKTT